MNYHDNLNIKFITVCRSFFILPLKLLLLQLSIVPLKITHISTFISVQTLHFSSRALEVIYHNDISKMFKISVWLVSIIFGSSSQLQYKLLTPINNTDYLGYTSSTLLTVKPAQCFLSSINLTERRDTEGVLCPVVGYW